MGKPRSARARAWGVGGAAIALGMAMLLSACTAPPPAPTPSQSLELSVDAAPDPAEVAAIRDAVEQTMADQHVRAAIVRVMRGDDVVLMEAWGDSMTGVPATTDMHFRSGAMSIPQMSTVLLQLAADGTVNLDDHLSMWLPEVPNADRVTLGQLAQMTSGYADYVQNVDFITTFIGDPYRQWKPEELYPYGTDQPLFYEPGTNWDYAHTNYVLLGLALEKILGQPLDEILAERILVPLGMLNTDDPGTPEIQRPVLHAFDSERRTFLQIPDGVPYIEESTYWNPSWSLARGSIQNTDVTDMATVMRAIGRGDLLDPESHALQIAPTLRGKTTSIDGCPTCFPQTEDYTYGYGIVLGGDWLYQNPLFHGFAGVGAYLASEDITIAVAATYDDEGFRPDGEPAANIGNPLFLAIAEVVAPDAALPAKR